MIKEELLHYLDDNPVVLKLDNNKGPLPLISFIEEALVIATSYKKNPRPMIIIRHWPRSFSRPLLSCMKRQVQISSSLTYQVV